MKSKLKTITAAVLLAFNSFSSYLIFIYVYLAIGGAIYSAEYNRFNENDLFYLLLGFQIAVSFIFTYLSSLIYLCRQMKKIKKHLVIIPILGSILFAAFGILLLWITDFQIE